MILAVLDVRSRRCHHMHLSNDFHHAAAASEVPACGSLPDPYQFLKFPYVLRTKMITIFVVLATNLEVCYVNLREDPCER